MTSDPREAYVWVWLPGRVEPVVAGRVYRDGDRLSFNYGRSYLERENAIPLYLPELPLRRGAIPPLPGLALAGCLRDGAPDAWGRRVVLNRLLGARGAEPDVGQLDELTYLLQSGSDRPGALDFQRSPTEYLARSPAGASLEQLLEAAALVEAGQSLPPSLDLTLFHGSSLGGARPKAEIESNQRKYIAKFSSSTDTYNVVKAEYVAMRLAARVGLRVAPVLLERVAGKDVLLVERFDRTRAESGWIRKAMVSALTLFGLDEMMARYASYETLAEIIRHRFHEPAATLRELFGRLVFNVLCGNTDDHARNHAAFWDGGSLALTPAYDICPQARTGNEASQAMLIDDSRRLSNLQVCRGAARHFLLSLDQAGAIIDEQVALIRDNLPAVMEEAELGEVDRRFLTERVFLNPAVFEPAS
ncbi:type II toxin-antitoxin system HipA family toxin [Alloalcanivorax sp. C16-1]|uniref:type II toxin-antitoxin system HipA family toxin n=1 Tax=Alloalcanivorax sp. C16-1 TaxID=3390051 RepID=UPI00397058D5